VPFQDAADATNLGYSKLTRKKFTYRNRPIRVLHTNLFLDLLAVFNTKRGEDRFMVIAHGEPRADSARSLGRHAWLFSAMRHGDSSKLPPSLSCSR
jgi:hypothetical protein